MYWGFLVFTCLSFCLVASVVANWLQMAQILVELLPYEEVALMTALWNHNQEQLFIQLMAGLVIKKGNK